MGVVIWAIVSGGLILILCVLGQRLGFFDSENEKRIPGIKCRCGHESWETKIWFGGRRILFRPPDYRDRCCAECFKKYARICSACGRIILPGDRVSICLMGKEFKPKGAKKLRLALGDRKYVLCTEPGCVRLGVQSEQEMFWDGHRFHPAPLQKTV